MNRTNTRRIACMLLTVSVGIVFVGASARLAARAEELPKTPLAPLRGSDATAGNHNTFWLVEEEDQASCWVAGAGSCLCSAGAVEDLLTPDFMRLLLTSWRDAGHLTTREWRERLREVDAACGSRSAGQ
jgi:hypothetical protein